MKAKKYSEEQIIGILREHEATGKTQEVCRKHGISNATLYNWKKKFGGMNVSDARRLKQLEAENAKLKKLVAEQAVDIMALKDINSKKW
jgi:putative transposase